MFLVVLFGKLYQEDLGGQIVNVRDAEGDQALVELVRNDLGALGLPDRL